MKGRLTIVILLFLAEQGYGQKSVNRIKINKENFSITSARQIFSFNIQKKDFFYLGIPLLPFTKPGIQDLAYVNSIWENISLEEGVFNYSTVKLKLSFTIRDLFFPGPEPIETKPWINFETEPGPLFQLQFKTGFPRL